MVDEGPGERVALGAIGAGRIGLYLSPITGEVCEGRYRIGRSGDIWGGDAPCATPWTGLEYHGNEIAGRAGRQRMCYCHLFYRR